jgi:hypothetical protein
MNHERRIAAAEEALKPPQKQCYDFSALTDDELIPLHELAIKLDAHGDDLACFTTEERDEYNRLAGKVKSK